MKRYEIVEIDRWQGADGLPRVTFEVRDLQAPPDAYRPNAHVWFDPATGGGTCVQCQGALGNSRSCRHVKAVQRHASTIHRTEPRA